MADLDQLKQKYAPVIETIESFSDLGAKVESVSLDGEKLYLKGSVPSQVVANRVWDVIKQVDPQYADLHHESKAVAELMGKLSKKGLQVDHYSAQDKPLFEIVEGEGERATVTPLFSIPEILNAVKAVGKKGIQMTRFKGLGEMDAKELFETTMNPVKRKLLRIELTDAVEAEEMFVRLMGDEVEPRRQFIQDNALNVRNLDV